MTHCALYFDYMATTPVDPRVVEEMLRYLGPEACFGNPASKTHAYGKSAALAVERAREQVAASINASVADIVFTSGATESDNLAIIGAARFYQNKGRHIITMVTEHKAVLDSMYQLEREGFEITYLQPDAEGILNTADLVAALRPDTILVSIMHVNNEIGVIQDIAAIGAILHDKGIIFHVDAAQAAGKLALDMQILPVDLMSFSGHKNYGPKGVGALYVRHKPRIRLQPQSFGGGHEGGMRSGTLATHQLAGMGLAFELAAADRMIEQPRILAQRERLWAGIKDIPGIRLNGHAIKRIAGNLNVSIAGIEGDSLLLALRELAVSTTSACASASMQPSYVLKALGLDDQLALSSVRISMGRFTKDEDIDAAIRIINHQCRRLQEISAL